VQARALFAGEINEMSYCLTRSNEEEYESDQTVELQRRTWGPRRRGEVRRSKNDLPAPPHPKGVNPKDLPVVHAAQETLA
jgi:hypothetical protein